MLLIFIKPMLRLWFYYEFSFLSLWETQFRELVMPGKHMVVRIFSVLLVLMSAVFPVHAIDRGTTATGMAFVSGGVGHSELLMLAEEKKNFSFWLTTASKGTGAYLDAVQIRIINTRTRQPVLEHKMDAPWLFTALPAGRYEVEASYSQSAEGSAQVIKKSATIQALVLRQMLLYFDTRDTVGKDDDPAFKFNPYNTH
jgi:hypothetical protein